MLFNGPHVVIECFRIQGRSCLDTQNGFDLICRYFRIAFDDNVFQGWVFYHCIRDLDSFRNFGKVGSYIKKISHLINGLQVLFNRIRTGFVTSLGLDGTKDRIFADCCHASDFDCCHRFASNISSRNRRKSGKTYTQT